MRRATMAGEARRTSLVKYCKSGEPYLREVESGPYWARTAGRFAS